MELQFFVAGIPKGRVHTTPFSVVRKKCPACGYEGRQELRNNLVRCSGCGRIYRPVSAVSAAKASPDQKVWVAAVKDQARAAAFEQGWEKPESGAIWVALEFVMPRPQAYNWRNPHPEPRHWKKPDRDNLEKAFHDAVRGILWRDDSQVSDGPPAKRYGRQGEECGVYVRMRYLGEWYDSAGAEQMAELRDGGAR